MVNLYVAQRWAGSFDSAAIFLFRVLEYGSTLLLWVEIDTSDLWGAFSATARLDIIFRQSPKVFPDRDTGTVFERVIV